MKFLADMGISPGAVTYLREQGFEALHLREQGLECLQDEKIPDKAQSEGWILLTHDLDFPELLALRGARLPSVVLFRLRDMRPQSVNRYLARVIDECRAELSAGAVVSVSEERLRLRSLPLNLEQAG